MFTCITDGLFKYITFLHLQMKKNRHRVRLKGRFLSQYRLDFLRKRKTSLINCQRTVTSSMFLTATVVLKMDSILVTKTDSTTNSLVCITPPKRRTTRKWGFIHSWFRHKIIQNFGLSCNGLTHRNITKNQTTEVLFQIWNHITRDTSSISVI